MCLVVCLSILAGNLPFVFLASSIFLGVVFAEHVLEYSEVVENKPVHSGFRW